MFKVNDRVRVIKFFGSEHAKSVGTTGTVTRVVEGLQLKGEPSEQEMYQYVIHVRLDRPQKIYDVWSNSETLTLLMYPDELEYEDNRQGAITLDLICYGGGSFGGDYVRLNNGLTNCRCSAGSKHPLAHVFQLFANYRKGDTALHVKCMSCGNVLGTNISTITPADVDNVMYMCNEPSLDNDRDTYVV